MNQLSDGQIERAVELFINNFSIREVCYRMGIARETAHRIYKSVKQCSLEVDGHFYMRTGGASNIGKKHFKKLRRKLYDPQTQDA